MDVSANKLSSDVRKKLWSLLTSFLRLCSAAQSHSHRLLHPIYLHFLCMLLCSTHTRYANAAACHCDVPGRYNQLHDAKFRIGGLGMQSSVLFRKFIDVFPTADNGHTVIQLYSEHDLLIILVLGLGLKPTHSSPKWFFFSQDLRIAICIYFSSLSLVVHVLPIYPPSHNHPANIWGEYKLRSTLCNYLHFIFSLAYSQIILIRTPFPISSIHNCIKQKNEIGHERYIIINWVVARIFLI